MDIFVIIFCNLREKDLEKGILMLQESQDSDYFMDKTTFMRTNKLVTQPQGRPHLACSMRKL